MAEGRSLRRPTCVRSSAEPSWTAPRPPSPLGQPVAMDDVTYTFTGSMSVARLEDWVEYVEGNLLREYLVSYFPDYVLVKEPFTGTPC